LAPLVDRCFSLEPVGESEALIHLDLDLIEQEINQPERFRRVSVVVVDYAMPSMSGLDLCRDIADPYIKKAMLTGVADEKLAVEAFNAGLINRFIHKQSADATATTLHYIDELQNEYFSQYTARLRNTLSIDPPRFLVDPAIAQWVEALMSEERLVEYYLVDDPPGLMLLRSNGSMLRALILHRQDMASQLAFANHHDAPIEVIEAIAANRAAGLFGGDSPAHYFRAEPYPWQDNLVSVSTITGTEDWFIGIVPDAPTDIDFDPRRAAYDAYLANLRRTCAPTENRADGRAARLVRSARKSAP
ncbi:MAG: response regulator, partial [Gammaproteobacteria bacterium]|nr:response regulator [Gammaproteobacteria bacterium]